jgi:hypothetical protein
MMAAARLLGLPYRVFFEVALATAALLLFRPLVSSTIIGLPTALFGCAILMFHPVLLLEMDRAMGDPVAFLWWLVGVAGLFGFLAAPRERLPLWNLALAIAAFAFAGLTRSGEGAIVFVVMGSAALLAALMFRHDEAWRGRRAAIACVCAILANVSATHVLSAAHYVNRGYWGATGVESREWWQLYRTLLSLPVERKDRHALIDRPTLALAEELSPTIRRMQDCWADHLKDWYPKTEAGAFPNFIVPWAFTGCAPGETSFAKFSSLRRISADIIESAGKRGVELKPPAFGIIPRAAAGWLPEYAASLGRVAAYVVRIPETTRVDYTAWDRLGPDKEAMLDQGLLRRNALVARRVNPELPLYQHIVWPIYSVLSWLIVPVAIMVSAAAVAAALRGGATFSTVDRIVLLLLALIFLEVGARICFYAVVDWVGWRIPLRYIVGARVLPVIGVAIVLAVWGVPRMRVALRRRAVPCLWWPIRPKIADIRIKREASYRPDRRQAHA